MNINEMKQSKYLKKEDAGAGKLVTIKNLTQEDMAQQGQDPDMKYVMYFNENVSNPSENKGMVMNWTNIQLCAKACGSEDTDNWPGKKVVIYCDDNVSYGGKLIGGIRIRAVQTQPAQSAQQATGQDFNDPIPGFDDNTPPSNF